MVSNTTARAVLDARHAAVDVMFYEIDKRTAAIEAVEAQRRRIHDRESELFKTLPVASRDAHRVWAYRHQVLSAAGRANSTLDRSFQLACEPLSDYDDVVRAATLATDEVLARERAVTIENIPGYQPDGDWICDKCGYPFDESATCFTCDACGEADPSSRATRRNNVKFVASESRYGGAAAAERLAESHRRRLEVLRWLTATHTD